MVIRFGYSLYKFVWWTRTCLVLSFGYSLSIFVWWLWLFGYRFWLSLIMDKGNLTPITPLFVFVWYCRTSTGSSHFLVDSTSILASSLKFRSVHMVFNLFKQVGSCVLQVGHISLYALAWGRVLKYWVYVDIMVQEAQLCCKL